MQELIRAFSTAGVECVLLKGAARLYADDPTATWTTLCDIDVLLRRDQAVKAFSTLEAIGYAGTSMHLWEHYLARHHHLVPLDADGNRKKVELHVSLAPPGTLSLANDWHGLSPFFETVSGSAGPALRLNRFGTALHLIVHGIGCYRFYDAVLLAMELRREPCLVGPLQGFLQNERVQKIPADAVLVLACRLAGLHAICDRSVERYLGWIFRREALPRYFQDRVQLIDAWFGNGGRLAGPCTALAWPDVGERDIRARTRMFYQSVGRVLSAAATFPYSQSGAQKW